MKWVFIAIGDCQPDGLAKAKPVIFTIKITIIDILEKSGYFYESFLASRLLTFAKVDLCYDIRHAFMAKMYILYIYI